MSPWPVIGHEWATELLAQAIRCGRPSHAYLFTGLSQVGKTTLARAFAQALLCESGQGAPCGGSVDPCRTCQRVAQGRYPDVQFIAAEKNAIQIDQVRALQADAAVAPLEGRRKIFIIQEIERATLPAANALLKSLEEPPPQVILLLTATRRDQVLPTILSRCQLVGLRPLPLEQVQTALQERWHVDEERAALLARLSGGRLGWAVTAHTDPELWQAAREVSRRPAGSDGGRASRQARVRRDTEPRRGRYRDGAGPVGNLVARCVAGSAHVGRRSSQSGSQGAVVAAGRPVPRRASGERTA